MKLRKAFIVELVGNLAKVRIPWIHGVVGANPYEPDETLPLAPIVGNKAIRNSLMVGDIVYVDFENDDLSKPVILGQMQLPEDESTIDETETKTATADLFIKDLKANGVINLSANTTIGEVSPTDISHLKGTKQNIQTQINNILQSESEFTAKYLQGSFGKLDKWRLDPRGIILTSSIIDDNDNSLDTIIPDADWKKAENSILDSTKSANSNGWKYNKGYNEDVKKRLNWLGVNAVKNDVVKYQSGLFARNYWDITRVKDSNNNEFIKNEYTFRPTIQSYVTKASGLSRVKEITRTADVQSYNDDWLPYNMLINPEGGDTHIGRGNNGIVIYDNDGPKEDDPAEAKLPRNGIRLIAKDYKENEGTADEKDVVGGDIIIQVKNNQLYQIDLKDPAHKEKKLGSGAGGGGVYFTVTSGTGENAKKYVNAYVQYGTTETYHADGLYDMADNHDQAESGSIQFGATIALILNQVSTSSFGQSITQDILPVSAQASLQLGSLKEYLAKATDETSGIKGVVVDLTTSLGVGWDNMYFHFMFRITKESTIDSTTDKISFVVENIGNYITEIQLSNNVISFNRANITTTVFYDEATDMIYTVKPDRADKADYVLKEYTIVSGSKISTTVDGVSKVSSLKFTLAGNEYTMALQTASTNPNNGLVIGQIPATINLSIAYNGVGVEGVTTSTIEVYEQDSIGGNNE